MLQDMNLGLKSFLVLKLMSAQLPFLGCPQRPAVPPTPSLIRGLSGADPGGWALNILSVLNKLGAYIFFTASFMVYSFRRTLR